MADVYPPRASTVTERWYLCALERHAEKIRARVGFEFPGLFGGRLGTGVAITQTPGVPFHTGATHEIELDLVAGDAVLEFAPRFVLNGVVYRQAPGEVLLRDGVRVVSVRPLGVAAAAPVTR